MVLQNQELPQQGKEKLNEEEVKKDENEEPGWIDQEIEFDKLMDDNKNEMIFDDTNFKLSDQNSE